MPNWHQCCLSRKNKLLQGSGRYALMHAQDNNPGKEVLEAFWGKGRCTLRNMLRIWTTTRRRKVHSAACSGPNPACQEGSTNLPGKRKVHVNARLGPNPADEALRSFPGRVRCTLPKTLPVRSFMGQREVHFAAYLGPILPRRRKEPSRTKEGALCQSTIQTRY